MRLTILLLSLFLLTPRAPAQTMVDLGSQARNVDFSQAPFTRPVRTGSVLPATCTVGELFFHTAAGAGSNLHGCTAANTWTSLGGITLALASQSEAEQGMENTRYMSPLRTAQAIVAQCALPAQSGHAGKHLRTDGSTATWTAHLTLAPSAAQTISGAGDSISANALNVRISPNNSYTLSSAPTIADGADGQLLLISNNSASHSVTLQDESILPNSNLRLGGSNVTIAPRGSLLLTYNAALASWVRADTVGMVGGGIGGGGAPSEATYITRIPHDSLPNAQALAVLSTGLLKNTTGTGVLSIATGADLPSHNHSASELTSGTLADARVAQSNVTQHQGVLSLGAGQITSGTFADARIAQSNVTQHQGALSLGAGQITSGTFADGRIAQSNVTQHQGALSLGASQITSGTLPLARGGTNRSSWTGGRCVRVNDAGTALEPAAADCGTGAGGETDWIIYRAARCQNTVAGAGFSTPATGAPTAVCVEGSNTLYATLQFADTATQSVQDHFTLPAGVSAVDLTGKWRSSATGGSVVWQIQTACAGDGEAGDPSWNAAQAIVDAAKSTAWQFNDFSLTGLALAGCSGGKTMFFRFFRDPAHASDDLNATAELIEVRFRVVR